MALFQCLRGTRLSLLGKLTLYYCDHTHGLIYLILRWIIWESFCFRKYVITEMKNALRNRTIDQEFFNPDVMSYLSDMAKNFTFIDNLFLKFFAVLTNRDITILSLYPESAVINKEFTWIFGMVGYYIWLLIVKTLTKPQFNLNCSWV